MAYSQSRSHETSVGILKDGLNESESMYKDLIQSSVFDDFFNADSLEVRKDTRDKERLASFEIGNLKPENFQWKIDENQVTVQGQDKRTTGHNQFVGRKFTRCIAIPQDILAETVTARFCSRDGVVIVEGCKKPTKSAKVKRSTFISNEHFSLSIDLGDNNPVTIGDFNPLQTGTQEKTTIELFK